MIDGVGNSLQEKDTAIIEGQGETILLVDDEDSIRSSTADVLNSLGYKVLSAADGEEALAMFGVYQHEISLVITDVVMPMIGGVDLAKAVRLLKKNMPILFITGYAKNQVMPIADQGEQIIITKPLPFAELSQTIRRMIDSN